MKTGVLGYILFGAFNKPSAPYHLSFYLSRDFHSYISTDIFFNSNCVWCAKSLKVPMCHMMTNHNLSGRSYNKDTNSFDKLYGKIHFI